MMIGFLSSCQSVPSGKDLLEGSLVVIGGLACGMTVVMSQHRVLETPLMPTSVSCQVPRSRNLHRRECACDFHSVAGAY